MSKLVFAITEDPDVRFSIGLNLWDRINVKIIKTINLISKAEPKGPYGGSATNPLINFDRNYLHFSLWLVWLDSGSIPEPKGGWVFPGGGLHGGWWSEQ